MDFALDYLDELEHVPAAEGRLFKGKAFDASRSELAPILLVHGAFHGAWCYGLWLRELDRRAWPAAAVDLRGHGGLAQNRRLIEAGVADMAEDVRAAIALMPAPPILCGHSLGALITGVAAENQDLAGLVLLAPSPPGQLPGARALPPLPEGRMVPPPDPPTAAKKFFPRLSVPEVALLQARLCPESPRLQNERFELRVPVRAETIEAPALGISCGLDNEDLHPPGQDEAVAAFYGGTNHHLPNASHCPMVDPDWSVGLNIITDWWQSRQT